MDSSRVEATMTRPKVPPDQRQRTAQACESCKRRKQKVSSVPKWMFQSSLFPIAINSYVGPPAAIYLRGSRELQPLQLSIQQCRSAPTREVLVRSAKTGAIKENTRCCKKSLNGDTAGWRTQLVSSQRLLPVITWRHCRPGPSFMLQ